MIATYRMVDQFGEPIRGTMGLVGIINGIPYINGVPVDQATIDAIQGNQIIPSASIEGHWYDPITGEDLGTTADMAMKRARYLAGQEYTVWDKIAEVGVVAVLTVASMGGSSTLAAGEAGAAIEASAGTAEAGTVGAETVTAGTSVETATEINAVGADVIGTPAVSSSAAIPESVLPTSGLAETTLSDILPQGLTDVLPSGLTNTTLGTAASGVAEKIYSGTGI